MHDSSGADAGLAPATEAGLIFRIESIPFSRWHSKARILIGSATFFDAFDALSLAFVLPVLIGLWHITPVQIGILIASSYVGQLIGALLFGWLAERYGRIRSITGAIGIMSIMSIACALCGNFNVLFWCRFVQGIGIGGEMPVAAAYISELSKAQGRGKYFLLYELLFPIGLMFTGQIGAWLVPTIGWEIMFWIGGISGSIITLFIYRLPESPRWLISKGRLPEADRIVQIIERSTDKRVAPSQTTQDAIKAAANHSANTPKRRQAWHELFSGFYRGRTLVVWLLWAATFFVANSLNNWLPTLYKTVYHLGLQDALRAASLTNVAQVLILLACAFCIDKVGRRNWAIASFIVGGALLSLLWYLGAGSVTNVIVLATLSYGVIGSVAAVVYLYTPEIYPTRIRATGTGLATSWLRLASAVGPALVGMMVRDEGIASVFLMLAGVCAVGALGSCLMIETRQRSLEEIAP
ncbi:MAG TPA: MFS transporter [Herbaspirillum sp.]|jgi:putative MFS transporter